MDTLKTEAQSNVVLTAEFTKQRTGQDSADKRSNQGNINPTLYTVTNISFMEGMSVIKTVFYHVD